MPYKYRDLPLVSRHFFVLYLHNELRKTQKNDAYGEKQSTKTQCEGSV
jgi:hypothetical protein